MDDKIKELERFLISLDSEFSKFAAEHKFKLSKNSKDWPERSFSWRAEGLNKLIQIYLESESQNTFLVWGCAWKDKLSKRYWLKLEPQKVSPPLEWEMLEKLFLNIKKELENVQENTLTLT